MNLIIGLVLVGLVVMAIRGYKNREVSEVTIATRQSKRSAKALATQTKRANELKSARRIQQGTVKTAAKVLGLSKEVTKLEDDFDTADAKIEELLLELGI